MLQNLPDRHVLFAMLPVLRPERAHWLVEREKSALGQQMLKEAGRDEASCPITLFNVQEDADLLKRYRDLGAVRVSVSLPAEKADKTLPVLDRWAKLIRTVNG